MINIPDCTFTYKLYLFRFRWVSASIKFTEILSVDKSLNHMTSARKSINIDHTIKVPTHLTTVRLRTSQIKTKISQLDLKFHITFGYWLWSNKHSFLSFNIYQIVICRLYATHNGCNMASFVVCARLWLELPQLLEYERGKCTPLGDWLL